MDFIKSLQELRNEKLAEISNEANKHALEDFRFYLNNILTDNKSEIEKAFINYVTNDPTVSKPVITREYSINNKYSHGFELFFNLESGKNVKDYIKDITQSEYCGFHITIKNSTVYPVRPTYYSNMPLAAIALPLPNRKISVRFEIDLTEGLKN